MRITPIPALLIAGFCATLALAGSPPTPGPAPSAAPMPRSTPAPSQAPSWTQGPQGAADISLEAPPPAELARNCRRQVSQPLRKQLNQRTTWSLRGTCRPNVRGEQEREMTQARLECLMGGWEDVVEFKISCKRFMAFASSRKIPALHYESSWRCARADCK